MKWQVNEKSIALQISFVLFCIFVILVLAHYSKLENTDKSEVYL